MNTKLALAAVAAIASAALIASPALAVGNSLYTLNPSGGSTSSDGLKVNVANGQMQVTSNGVDQLYPTGTLPDVASQTMNNWWGISITDSNAGVVRIGQAGYADWNHDRDFDLNFSGSSQTVSDDGKSGSVVNTLDFLASSSDIPGFDGGMITLQVTYNYTFPNRFVNIESKLILPAGFSLPTRVYWNTDATLGGADAGDQFEGILDSNQQVRGVVSPEGTQIEAFRQVAGQTMNSWAGHFTCPWEDAGTECNSGSAFGWQASNTDAPNLISGEYGVDNGFGVSAPVVSTAGEHITSFDVLFVDCLDGGVSALQCVNASVSATDPGVAAESAAPALATTGSDSTVSIAAALTLMLAGLAVAALRRRARA